MKTRRRIAETAIIASLYAVLTWCLSPISYGALQFRFAEILKPLALRDRRYIGGLTVGLLVANMISPMVGPWELIWMPLAGLVGGFAAYRLRKNRPVALLVYAAIIGSAVAVMLRFVLGVSLFATVLPLVLSETVLMMLGDRLIDVVFRRVKRV